MTTRSRRRWTLVTLLLAFPRGGSGQEAKSARTGLELSAFFGDFNDRPEIGPNAVFVNPAAKGIFGGFLGYHFPQHFFLEAEGAYAPMEMTGRFARVLDLNVTLLGASVGYTLPVAEPLDLFGSVGGGLAVWSPSGFSSERDLMLHYDVGARYFFTPHFALRADAGIHHVPDALGSTAASVAGVTLDKEAFWGWTFTGGISFFLGGKRDADKDGVVDAMDACPGTPRGVTVDARGCPVDTDRDGVADYMDRCPDTPAGARVDASGCPTDSDKDGVFDGLDRCGDTPAGATVDTSGCPSDADRDGVLDGIDQCANTPAGATVDARGCPSDSDRDGVFDGIDKCPDTAAGSQVDAQGCPVSQVQRALEEEGTFTFGDLNFAFNSAELRPGAETELQEVGRVLTSRPNDRMELVGFTDSVGSDAYNQKLSLRRAQAVRDYLIRNFPGLGVSRFEVRGLGEAQPVADNGTEQGRSQNRRVEIRLIR
jgi:OmpA-OmpF porin, OOP family